MPEFQLNLGTPDAADRFHKLDQFTQAYIEAMFFTDASDPDDGDLQDATVHDLAEETWNQIASECAAFQEAATDLLSRAYTQSDGTYDDSRAGHDFWLTRNGHGAGFWDRKELERDDLGDQLSALCGWRTAFSERSIYRGDDGLVYMCEG